MSNLSSTLTPGKQNYRIVLNKRSLRVVTPWGVQVIQRNIIQVFQPFFFIFDQFPPISREILHQKVLGARLFKQEHLFSIIQYVGFISNKRILMCSPYTAPSKISMSLHKYLCFLTKQFGANKLQNQVLRMDFYTKTYDKQPYLFNEQLSSVI